jgi:anti-sigma factor (TIGR02949 family)
VLLERCSCAEVGERLSEYLDRELGTLDRTRVALHLTACPRCAAAAAGLAETIRAVHRSSGWIARRLGRLRH